MNSVLKPDRTVLWRTRACVLIVLAFTTLAHAPQAVAQQDSPAPAIDAQGGAPNAPETQSAGEAPPDGETQPAGDAAPPPDVIDPMLDPEFKAEYEKRKAKFDEVKDQLREAVFKQREISVRYVNREDRTPADREDYFDQRQKVRRLLDETFSAALDAVRMYGEPETATFLATWVQHRLQHDIYTADTLEASTRLIDGGSNLTLLFKAAARSAVVVGQFDLAKKLLDFVDDEQLEDIDRALEFNLDRYRQQFEAEQEIREKEIAEDRLPRVLLKTTQGDVTIELFIDSAPSTVSHFIKLVEQGFYDGLDFHQVLDHLLALTGDPSGVGTGGSGVYLMDEHTRPDARKAFRGSLLMAKIPQGEGGQFVPNSASSQFAILFLPMISAAENQTVFGRVIDGMDAVSRMRRVDPSKEKKKNEVQLPPDRIIEATVLRRPDELPEPEYWQRPTP